MLIYILVQRDQKIELINISIRTDEPYPEPGQTIMRMLGGESKSTAWKIIKVFKYEEGEIISAVITLTGEADVRSLFNIEVMLQ